MQKSTTIISLILLLLLLGASFQARAQDDHSVAILVVDVFENNPPTESLTESEENCFNPFGQDSYTWGGGSGVEMLDPFLYPHGRLVFNEFQFMLESILGLQDSTSNETSDETWGGGDIVRPPWWRDDYTYVLDSRRLRLIGIDVDGYRTSAITDRIEKAIATLEDEHTSRIIVNMSFSIVPCEDLTELNECSYISVILEFAKHSIGYQREDPETPEDMLIEGFGDLSKWLGVDVESIELPIDQDNCEKILSDMKIDKFEETMKRDPQDFQNQAEFLRTVVYMAYLLPIYEDRVTDLYTSPDGEVQPPPAGCDAYRNQINQINQINSTTPLDPIQSTNDPLFQLLTALNNVCGLDGYPVPDSIENNPIVITVASAGNDTFKFPYFPAVWPNTLSVSAWYSVEDLRRCDPISSMWGGGQRVWPNGYLALRELYDDKQDDNFLFSLENALNIFRPEDLQNPINVRQALEKFILPIRPNENEARKSPTSNSGEIQMNGMSYIYELQPTSNHDWGIPIYEPVFTCIWGTSFAAPRLSLEMALFLMWDDVASCHNPATIPTPTPGPTASTSQTGQSTGNRSDIPLHYPDWGDKSRGDATQEYCLVFDDTFESFFDTSSYPDFTNDIVFPEF